MITITLIHSHLISFSDLVMNGKKKAGMFPFNLKEKMITIQTNLQKRR